MSAPAAGADAPRPIVALVVTRPAQARLTDAVRGRAGLLFVRTTAALADAAVRARLVIVEPTDADGVSVAPVVSQLRAGYPDVPVIAYCDARRLSPGQLVHLARAGVSEVLLQGIDDVRAVITNALASAERECTADLVLARLRGGVSREAYAIIEFFLRHAVSAVSVHDAATALGQNRKTLFNRLAAEHGVTPSEIAAWARLLVAARMLDAPGRTADDVALEAGFPSGTAFRNMLRRHTGLTPSALRSELGFTGLCRRFEALLRGPRRPTVPADMAADEGPDDEDPPAAAAGVLPGRARGDDGRAVTAPAR
jgi:AraC-like DNA-binding protein